MALTAAQRKANQRARAAGEPEPYQKETAEQKEAKKAQEAQYFANRAYAESLDQTGKFYKSECRSTTKLFEIYYGGLKLGDLQEEEGEETKPTKKVAPPPAPYKTKITIRAIETVVDGKTINIDPNMIEHRHFTRWTEC